MELNFECQRRLVESLLVGLGPDQGHLLWCGVKGREGGGKREEGGRGGERREGGWRKRGWGWTAEMREGSVKWRKKWGEMLRCVCVRTIYVYIKVYCDNCRIATDLYVQCIYRTRKEWNVLYNIMYTTSSRAPKRKFRVHMTIKMPKCYFTEYHTNILPVSSSKISLPIEQPLLQASGWGDCVWWWGGGRVGINRCYKYLSKKPM